MRRLLAAFVVVAVVLAAYLYSNEPDSDPEAPPQPEPASNESAGDTANVRVVHDGDSFAIDEGTDVRMIGINAPDFGECLHHEARSALKDLLAAGPVDLVRDVSDSDRYGRLLRYVQVDGTFVNQEMVERGLALVVSADPDMARRDELAAAQQRARPAGLGIWNVNACGPAASTDVHIVEVSADPRGRDQDNLNGEYVVIRNAGPTAVDLTGWKLRDDSTQNRFWFPAGFSLGAQADVTVHVGSGDDTADALYWGRRYPVWDNRGDTALLLDPQGNAVSVVDVGAG